MSGATTERNSGIYDGDERCFAESRVGNIKILEANEVVAGFRNVLYNL